MRQGDLVEVARWWRGPATDAPETSVFATAESTNLRVKLPVGQVCLIMSVFNELDRKMCRVFTSSGQFVKINRDFLAPLC